ncbi:hypothetical protein AB0I54_20645 [Streptomyces sp. NPDC050625]|uniref:hypothetical protein n=1 Tax=Streptomyces sp. NPDC050625 TaxID=3154629 RepID=UPI00341C4EE1
MSSTRGRDAGGVQKSLHDGEFGRHEQLPLRRGKSRLKKSILGSGGLSNQYSRYPQHDWLFWQHPTTSTRQDFMTAADQIVAWAILGSLTLFLSLLAAMILLGVIQEAVRKHRDRGERP